MTADEKDLRAQVDAAFGDAAAYTTDTPGAAPLVDPTGVPNLDMVLGGGLARGSLGLIVGPPGSGKTTLATQMAFAAGAAGRRVLILTALSEPTNKLMAHLRSFHFFREEMIGDTIQVLSLRQFLPRGLEATADELTGLVRAARASLVVLDGFRGMRGVDVDTPASRQFLYEVGTALSILGATTLITSEAEPRDQALFPEATTADILLGVHYGLNGVRQRRAIEVIKARGAAPLAGLHGLRLTADGAMVYPRLEARVVAGDGDADQRGAMHGRRRSGGTADALDDGAPTQEESPLGRVSFGLPELDALLDGGLSRETNTLLLGSLGTGKTLLALHLAATSVAAGRPVLFVGFRENRRQITSVADAFNLSAQLRVDMTPDGAFTLLRLPPVELDPDVVGDNILAALDRTGARVLIVDSIAELERAAARGGDPARVDDYLAALTETLRGRGVTSLFIKEAHRLLAAQFDVSTDAISVLAENVVLLQQLTYHERLHRVLSVLKMRFSAHDLLLREFRITVPGGIQVLTPVQSEADVLAGIARQQGEPAPAGPNSDESTMRRTP